MPSVEVPECVRHNLGRIGAPQHALSVTRVEEPLEPFSERLVVLDLNLSWETAELAEPVGVVGIDAARTEPTTAVAHPLFDHRHRERVRCSEGDEVARARLEPMRQFAV